MLSQNENSQIKVFETLIKSVLFIYFQERMKSEEGLDLNKVFSDPPAADPKSKSKQAS